MSNYRAYVPLTGKEVKEIILKELDKQFDNDTEFRQHVTYPEVEWDFTLTLHCVERVPPRLSRGLQGIIQTLDPETKKPTVTDDDDVVVYNIRRGRPSGKDLIPDHKRIENNMPVNVPKQTTHGVVDEQRYEGKGVIVNTRAAEEYAAEQSERIPVRQRQQEPIGTKDSSAPMFPRREGKGVILKNRAGKELRGETE